MGPGAVVDGRHVVHALGQALGDGQCRDAGRRDRATAQGGGRAVVEIDAAARLERGGVRIDDDGAQVAAWVPSDVVELVESVVLVFALLTFCLNSSDVLAARSAVPAKVAVMR